MLLEEDWMNMVQQVAMGSPCSDKLEQGWRMSVSGGDSHVGRASTNLYNIYIYIVW